MLNTLFIINFVTKFKSLKKSQKLKITAIIQKWI
jgi:hypothetical protein